MAYNGESKISVVVVGAGFGGLATAIELARKGCSVRVFELAKDLTRQGKHWQILLRPWLIQESK